MAKHIDILFDEMAKTYILSGKTAKIESCCKDKIKSNNYVKMVPRSLIREP